MSNSIHIYGLGNRNPLTESDQIIWFLEQQAKTVHKKQLTRYWLNVKERYAPRLLFMQAYEILALINSKSTAAQEKKRMEYRTVAKFKAELEMAAWKKQYEEEKVKRHLIRTINYN